MMVYPNLMKAMDECGVSITDLAELTGESVGAVSLKTQGIVEWTLTEALLLCNRFNYTDIKKLFLRLDYN